MGRYKALEIGLVDRLGNLEDCIMALAEENGANSYSIVEYPDPRILLVGKTHCQQCPNEAGRY